MWNDIRNYEKNDNNYQEELKNQKNILSSNNCGNIIQRMKNNLDDYQKKNNETKNTDYEFEKNIKYIKNNIIVGVKQMKWNKIK